MLDEVTAPVNHATDEVTQAGLRASVAAGTTVLTIAHRLLTIADNDYVVVPDAGHVVEQGSVRDLMDHCGETAISGRICKELEDLGEIESAAASS